jgi:large subunit ribosomal protein L25
MQHPQIHATVRPATGTSAAQRYRAARQIPAVIMSRGEPSRHILLDETSVNLALSQDTHLWAIELDGRITTAMPKEVTRNCLTDRLQHVDLLAVNEESQVTVEVPLHPVIDDCPGLKSGGLLEQMLRKIRVRCAVKDIPDAISIDLGQANIGDTIYAESVPLPERVRLLTPVRTALMSVIKTRTLKKAEADTEGGVPAAEGEAATAPAEPAAEE